MRGVLFRILSIALAFDGASVAFGYPLDGYKDSGISRVEAYRIAQKNKIQGAILPPGAELLTSEIKLSLVDQPGFKIPPPDPVLSQELRAQLGSDAPSYGVALLDLSDPNDAVYAEHNANMPLSPGSIGKVLVALGMFQTLAETYPDIESRKKILRDTQVVADEFIIKDDHEVPFWRPGDYRVSRRPIEIGDQMNLYSLMDHMISPSSNAAAALVQKEAMQIHHFGAEYPVSPERANDYIYKSSPSKLARDLDAVLHDPVRENGLDPRRLRQGGFFTKTGKARVPGAGSYATAGELVELMVQMEKGQLVDPWSSMELKKLMYLTERRIRYASSPSLDKAAVYFKSGSLFKCRPEPGFFCEKYHGNVTNFMNSVAIIEEPKRKPPLRYIVAVMSNVLRKNSAKEHRDLGARIQALMEERHPAS